jgi:hypothetical protein
MKSIGEPGRKVCTVTVLYWNDFIPEVLREVVSTARGHIQNGGDTEFFELFLHAGV